MHVGIEDAREHVAPFRIKLQVGRVGDARRQPHDLAAHDADLEIQHALRRHHAPAADDEIEPFGLVDSLGIFSDNGTSAFHDACWWAILRRKSTITRNAISRSAAAAYSSGW